MENNARKHATSRNGESLVEFIIKLKRKEIKREECKMHNKKK